MIRLFLILIFSTTSCLSLLGQTSSFSERKKQYHFTPYEPARGFVKEYLRTVKADIQHYLNCPHCPEDEFTYLRPVRYSRSTSVWLFRPFFYRSFGIENPEEHPVFSYMHNHLKLVGTRPGRPKAFLVEEKDDLSALLTLIGLQLNTP